MSGAIELVLATRNQKKLGELQELVAPHGIQVLNLADFPDVPETVEDQETFAGNAAKKASEVALATGRWAMADDSGLCVDALGGAPGVYSARFAGEPPDDAKNNKRLVEELASVPESRRTAYYVCSIAVANPKGQVVLSEEATCRGRIVLEPRGSGGFGYDPYFELLEYRQTFGELPPVVKRHLSHRGRALDRIRWRLLEIPRGGPPSKE